jgi:hypothetical protein
MSLDDQFPFQDNAQSNDPHVASQYHTLSEDYKQANFDAFVSPDELEQLCNPAQAVFTNTRRIKVILE